MADIEAVEMLTQAKERLFDRGWCTSIGFGGQEMCLGQALSGGRSWGSGQVGSVRYRATGYLERAIGLPNTEAMFVWSWNDRQKSAGPIFDAIDRAVEIAKDAPNPAS